MESSISVINTEVNDFLKKFNGQKYNEMTTDIIKIEAYEYIFNMLKENVMNIVEEDEISIDVSIKFQIKHKLDRKNNIIDSDLFNLNTMVFVL